MRRTRLLSVMVVCSMCAATACSSDTGDATADPSADEASTTTSTARTAPAATTLVARAEVDVLSVFDSDAATAPAMELDRREEATGVLVFVVDEEAQSSDGRHKVQLPVRPNGSIGWIDADDVSLSVHDYRIEVDLGGFELTLFQGEDELLVAPIGTGTQDTPTPGGTYYIKELLQPPEPDGPYGTYAYGLSGFSNVLDDFAGGDGVIGLHGTNQPELIGTEVSHGCIRMENSVIDRLVTEIGLPLGVPVTIVA